MNESQILQYIEYDDKLSHEWFIFQGTEEGTIYDFYKEHIRPDLDDRILALTIEKDIYYEEAETLIDDEDYWVLTDEEANEKAELEGEYLLENALSEVPSYLHRYFDSDQYLKDQVSNDRGHMLNTYNGSEDSITLDNVSVYYIYRRN